MIAATQVQRDYRLAVARLAAVVASCRDCCADAAMNGVPMFPGASWPRASIVASHKEYRVTLHRFRYVLIILSMALLAGCTPLQVQLGDGAKLANAAAARVIAAYHITGLLARADTIVTDALLEDLPSTVDEAQRQQLQQQVATIFADARLTAKLTRQLAQQALDNTHVSALMDAADRLETPLARRLHRLQETAGEDGFAAAYNAYAQQPHRDRRATRLQRVRALMQAMDTIELQSAFHATLLQAVLQTRNALTQSMLAPTAIQIKLADSRRMLRGQLQEQLPQILLYVYRDVSDRDLQKYVKMQQSTALTWTNQALVKAIGIVLEQASQQLQTKARNL